MESKFDRREEGSAPPIVFFHSGNRIPRHLVQNLRYTSKQYSRKIVLLCDAPFMNFPGVDIIDFRGWFDDGLYREFRNVVQLPSEFRDDFWNKASMRFFVIDQFVKQQKIERFLHVESDVLLLGNLSFLRYLDAVGRGVFYPIVSQNLAISSVFYCNWVDSLNYLLHEFLNAVPGDSEMEVLARFASKNNSPVFGLPNTATLLRDKNLGDGFTELNPTRELGVFDAAHIGHWLLGEDPRNRPGRLVKNQYVVDYGICPPQRTAEFLRTSLIWREGRLSLPCEEELLTVQCIHVHSKALYLFTRKSFRSRVVDWASSQRLLPLPIWPTFQNYWKSQLKRRLDIQIMKVKRFTRKHFPIEISPR